MKTQTILALAAVGIAGSFLFGKKKIDEYLYVVENLQTDIGNIKSPKFKGQDAEFTVDVQLSNPTEFSIVVPGNKIIVRNLHFFTPSGKYLGTASPNISNLDLPANGSRLLPNIPVTVPFSSLTSGIGELISILSNPDNLQITVDFEVFGKQFTF